jgi:hypothetical protein
MRSRASRRERRRHPGGTESAKKPMRPAGFEPATHSLEGCCSIHLSYGRQEGNAIKYNG